VLCNISDIASAICCYDMEHVAAVKDTSSFNIAGIQRSKRYFNLELTD